MWFLMLETEMTKYLFIVTIALIVSCNALFAQKKYYPVAFYNVENLFDTKKEKYKNDDDFTPRGRFEWTQEKYNKKISNISEVISKLGKDKNKAGAVIIGLAEVENRKVVEDLVQQSNLSKSNYQIIHSDSPDSRGIDVALLYNPTSFKQVSYKIYPYNIPGRKKIKTRDILLVSGKLDDEPVSILVNHWPSRGSENSSPPRDRAAAICKQICDSLYNNNKEVKIIVMGDLNDDPQDVSTRVVLNAKKNKQEVKTGGLYNTMWNLLDNGLGSLKYRGEWNLFDQIIISHSLLSAPNNKLKFEYARVFNEDFLFQKSGKYKGYPFRTFSGNTFINGYSDHLPTIIYLTKEN